MTQITILNHLASIKKDAQALGFEKIGLFGSYATSSAHAMSDIDVTVCSNKEKTGLGFEYMEKVDSLRAILQKLFKRPVDIYDLSRSKKTPIMHHIEQEVIYV